MDAIRNTVPPTKLREFRFRLFRFSSCSSQPYKIRLSTLRRNLTQNSEEFCRNTTLHGLKYIIDENLYPIERIFFFISFCTVVFLSGFFILKVYEKWSTTPVIYSINSEPTYITSDPFPAVTICNLNQAYKSKAEQYSIFSVEHAMLQMLCKRQVNVSVADTITDWNNLKQFIEENSQPCSNMLLQCRYGAIEYNCSELFHPTITDEGLCCAFNMEHPSFLYTFSPPLNRSVFPNDSFVPVEWHPEKGYPNELPPKYFPRPTVGTGESMGLSIVLDVESDQYYCSSASSVGFKMLLHIPTEIPNVREIGLLLAPGRETKARIRVDKTDSVQALRSVDKRFRQCLFQDEGKLTFYSFYSQRNCEVECVAKMLLRQCGCLSHFMPKLYGNESVCSIYDSRCVERVRLFSKRSQITSIDCKDVCLPSCYDLTYLPDFFSTPLSHDGFQIVNSAVRNLSSNYVEKNIAVVHMYFKEYSYRSIKQAELFGSIDVLSSVGGLIGLFFGFSFISLVEFIFFAVIRPFRHPRQANRSFVKIENLLPPIRSPQQSPKEYRRAFKGFKNPFQLINPSLSSSKFGNLYDGQLDDQTWLSKEFLNSISQKVEDTGRILKH